MAGVPIVPGDAERELHHVEPADVEGARGVQPAQHGCRHRRHVALEDRRAHLAEAAGAMEHVLVGERHAVQRPAQLARAALGIRRLGRLQGLLAMQPGHGVELRALLLQRVEAGGRRRDRGHVARADPARQLGHAELENLGSAHGAPSGAARLRRLVVPGLGLEGAQEVERLGAEGQRRRQLADRPRQRLGRLLGGRRDVDAADRGSSAFVHPDLR